MLFKIVLLSILHFRSLDETNAFCRPGKIKYKNIIFKQLFFLQIVNPNTWIIVGMHTSQTIISQTTHCIQNDIKYFWDVL